MTIYALSTGPGVSGIAIIRVSGEDTSKVIKYLTGGQLPKARIATLCKIQNIDTSELIGFLGLRATQVKIWPRFIFMGAKP